MLEEEDRSEKDNSEHPKGGSGFSVAAIWIGAIGILALAVFLSLVLVFSSRGHNHHSASNDGLGHRSSANQGNMDDGMQPAREQTPSATSKG